MSDDFEEQLSPEQQSEADELARAYREVLNSAAGKRVIFDILETCAIFTDPFAGEYHASTAHELGKQWVGRKMIAGLNAIDPRIYPQLLFDVADLKAMKLAAAERATATEDTDDAP